MVVEGFQVFLCDTATGKFTRAIPPSKLKWGARLNDAGTVQVSMQADAAEVRHLDLRTITAPIRQSLGVSYGGQILECGPIWKHSYDADTEELALTASGLWSIFDHRKALPGAALAATASPTKAVISLSGLTLGSIARELVRISIQDNPFGFGGLNIVLPASVAGTNVRTYNGFDLAWIGDRLRQLTQVQNGPDIRFRPRFNGADPTVVEWAMETGSDTQPLLQQAGSDWVWDATVPASPVVKLSVETDATGLAMRTWVPGSGQEQNMKLAFSTNTNLCALGWPWLEADSASKQVEDQAVLQGYADRMLADALFPWDQWSIQVRADQSPLLGAYLPGDWVQLIIPAGHPMVPAGQYRVRILAIDGDHTQIVKITVAPIQGSF